MKQKRKYVLRGKKKLMLENMISSLGNVTIAAKKTGIDRHTHYNWLKNDKEYAMLIKDIDEIEIDFYEQAIRKNIENGNPISTIFALKAKGKKRGWVEKTESEITHKAEPFKVIIDMGESDGK